MKKLYLYTLLFVAAVLLSAGIDLKSELPPVLPPTPYLPSVPYNYDIDFPDYLLNDNLWVSQNASNVNYNLSDQKATLGRVLFYDKLLSADNSLSCASCHKQAYGFGDNVSLSEGIGGAVTERNSPSLIDLGWQGSYTPPVLPLFWDGREDDLHEMVLQPIVHEGELGKDLEVLLGKLSNTEYYPSLFEDAFGDPSIEIDRVAEALSQFVRSLSGFDTKFDRVMNGEASFTPAELAGQQLFNANCEICHHVPHFRITTPTRNFFPTDDPGFGAITGNPSDTASFTAPSLRNIALSAPYMHDGKFGTLEEVLGFYSDSLDALIYNLPPGTTSNLGAIDFDEEEIWQLIAFLETLTSPSLTTHPKFSDPFDQLIGTTGHAELQGVSIYPNPFTDWTVLEWSNPESRDFHLRLYRQDGMAVRSLRTRESSLKLDRDGLPPGIYLLELQNATHRKALQVLIR